MSAPITACELADAIGALLLAAENSLGCKVEFGHVTGTDAFCAVVWDHGRAFHGIDDTPSRALLNANAKRQDFAKRLAA